MSEFWKKGDRVKLSPDALALAVPLGRGFDERTRGTVERATVYAKAFAGLRVRVDGRKTTGDYHSAFWIHADKRVTARRTAAIERTE